MSILGIGPELSHYNTRKIHTFTKQSDFLSNTGIKSSDTVHISNKGKGLARNGFHVDISDPKIKADHATHSIQYSRKTERILE